jgi:NTP pyrophosphatase (non-canonical NTP hydrolase)
MKERDWEQFHSPENLAKSICIESGELLECFQWGGDFSTTAVRSELADVVTYCVLLANSLDWDLDEIVVEKLSESATKYPVARSRGRSLKYDQL